MIAEKELLELIDGKISGLEAHELLNKINDDANLKAQYQSLLKIHGMLEKQPPLSPSVSFNQNIMENLAKHIEVATARNIWRRNMFFAVAIVLVVFVTASILLSNYSLGNVLPLENGREITIQEKTFYFNPGKVFDQDIFFKGLIYLNAFLGLFLLEKAVLRPFFSQRKRHLSV
jgi:hypothetical protein